MSSPPSDMGKLRFAVENPHDAEPNERVFGRWRNVISVASPMIVSSVILSPLITFVGALLPSRENTIIDELPAMALTWALIGLAIAGVARVGYALVAERGRSHLRVPTTFDQLGRSQRERLEVAQTEDRPREIRSGFDTPL